MKCVTHRDLKLITLTSRILLKAKRIDTAIQKGLISLFGLEYVIYTFIGGIFLHFNWSKTCDRYFWQKDGYISTLNVLLYELIYYQSMTMK